MEEIVDFWIAKKLKEKGFREKCLYRYSPYSKTLHQNQVETEIPRKVDLSEFYKCYNVYEDNDIGAPTISQVLEWLRGKDIMVEIPITLGDDGTWKYSYRVHTKKFTTQIITDFSSCEAAFIYSSYEEAATKGIQYVLDILMREDTDQLIRTHI